LTAVRHCRIAVLPNAQCVHEPLLTADVSSVFVRRPEKLLKPEEHDQLLFRLASHPQAGYEILGTGGIRKMRFAAHGASSRATFG
jgi:hypothetical protein